MRASVRKKFNTSAVSSISIKASLPLGGHRLRLAAHLGCSTKEWPMENLFFSEARSTTLSARFGLV